MSGSFLKVVFPDITYVLHSSDSDGFHLLTLNRVDIKTLMCLAHTQSLCTLHAIFIYLFIFPKPTVGTKIDTIVFVTEHMC